MGLKVAVIGGGSTYTPELIDGLANRRARFQIRDVHLVPCKRNDIITDRPAVFSRRACDHPTQQSGPPQRLSSGRKRMTLAMQTPPISSRG